MGPPPGWWGNKGYAVCGRIVSGLFFSSILVFLIFTKIGIKDLQTKSYKHYEDFLLLKHLLIMILKQNCKQWGHPAGSHIMSH